MNIIPVMEEKCNLECTENMDYCCICCPKKDSCNAQCDYLDLYEYTQDCRYYRKEEQMHKGGRPE